MLPVYLVLSAARHIGNIWLFSENNPVSIIKFCDEEPFEIRRQKHGSMHLVKYKQEVVHGRRTQKLEWVWMLKCRGVKSPRYYSLNLVIKYWNNFHAVEIQHAMNHIRHLGAYINIIAVKVIIKHVGIMRI